MESVTVTYISCREQELAVQKLVTMTCEWSEVSITTRIKVSLEYVLINAVFADDSADVFQKLSAVEHQRVCLKESGAHRVTDKL